MKDKIELKIISIDGKIIEDSVDEIYFDIPLRSWKMKELQKEMR